MVAITTIIVAISAGLIAIWGIISQVTPSGPWYTTIPIYVWVILGLFLLILLRRKR